MNASPFIRNVLLVAFAAANAAAAEEPESHHLDMSGDKIVVVNVGDPQRVILLENAELKTIQGREFLVGRGLLRTACKPATERTVVIAWEEVAALEIYEDLEAYRRRDELSDDEEARLQLEMEKLREQAPLEFKIESLRKQIRDMTREIRYTMHGVAREEVELERLTKHILEVVQRIADQRRDIERLKTDLARGDERFEYSGKTYTAEQVKEDLEQREQRLQTSELTVGQLKELEQARKKGLEAAREKIERLIVEKRQLEMRVWQNEQLCEDR
jgi:hypothetical protein